MLPSARARAFVCAWLSRFVARAQDETPRGSIPLEQVEVMKQTKGGGQGIFLIQVRWRAAGACDAGDRWRALRARCAALI